MSIPACAQANVNSLFDDPVSSGRGNCPLVQHICDMSTLLADCRAARFGHWGVVTMAAMVANALFEKATVFIRSDDGVLEVEPSLVTETLLASANPWRTFRSYRGLRHYSGSYYSMTDRRPVIYESRLELARALLADFSLEVHRICAQLCLLRTRVNGRLRRHTPDFMFFGSAGLTLSVVKPAYLLDDPKVAATIAWVRGIAEDAGWVRPASVRICGPSLASRMCAPLAVEESKSQPRALSCMRASLQSLSVASAIEHFLST
jgi:hypothetical protein